MIDAALRALIVLSVFGATFVDSHPLREVLMKGYESLFLLLLFFLVFAGGNFQVLFGVFPTVFLALLFIFGLTAAAYLGLDQESVMACLNLRCNPVQGMS